jgi:TctA family transporter
MNKKVSIIAFVIMIIILTICITCVGYALGIILIDNLSGNIRYSMSWAIIVAAIINCVAAFGIYCASCELKDIIDK